MVISLEISSNEDLAYKYLEKLNFFFISKTNFLIKKNGISHNNHQYQEFF